MIVQPWSTEYGSDILNTWSMAAVLPMGEARFFDNFLADGKSKFQFCLAAQILG